VTPTSGYRTDGGRVPSSSAMGQMLAPSAN